MVMTLKRKLCCWQSPTILVDQLVEYWGQDGFIWLDGDGSQLGRWLTLGVEPIEEICCRGLPLDKNSVNPFTLLKELKPGHWTGWLSYEAAAWIEPSNPWKKDKMAMLWIASHDPVLKFDLIKKELWLEGCDEKRIKKFSNWLDKISTPKNKNTPKSLSSYKQLNDVVKLNSWKYLSKKTDYADKVKLIKKLIRDGDIFQANLTTCCETKLQQGSSLINIFKKLRKHCPSPFGGIIIGSGLASGEAILSSSPERFLKVLPTGEIETRPIKGTRPRNADPIKDAAMAAELVCSEKDRSENIMIVDLLRNDLGRVCEPGSINVPQLVGLESYTQVHHLTSVITGSLKVNKTWIDLLEACWPGGSITGAPKLRACKRLNELESISRGPYCGSFINLDWNGKFDSNILIRSLIVKDEILRAHAGGGIVADSDPMNEAEEMDWKLRPLLQALEEEK